METITEKIERYKFLAEDFLRDNIRVAIIDINNEYYFADIVLVGEDKLLVQCFSPKNKDGNKYYLRWASIIKFDEYKEEVGR